MSACSTRPAIRNVLALAACTLVIVLGNLWLTLPFVGDGFDGGAARKRSRPPNHERRAQWVDAERVFTAATRRARMSNDGSTWPELLHESSAVEPRLRAALLGSLRTRARTQSEIIARYQRYSIGDIVHSGERACEIVLVALDLCDPQEAHSSTLACVAQHGWYSLTRTLPTICAHRTLHSTRRAS